MQKTEVRQGSNQNSVTFIMAVSQTEKKFFFSGTSAFWQRFIFFVLKSSVPEAWAACVTIWPASTSCHSNPGNYKAQLHSLSRNCLCLAIPSTNLFTSKLLHVNVCYVYFHTFRDRAICLKTKDNLIVTVNRFNYST